MKLDDVRYMQFAGGGTRGTMYLGMMHALEDHAHHKGIPFAELSQQFQGFAGTSAGSIFALSMTLKLSYEQCAEIFQPVIADPHNIAPRTDLAALFTNFGLDDGKSLRQLIDGILHMGGLSSTVTFATISRLLSRELIVVATNAHTRQPQHFSARDTPDMSVADAVYMSMSVPFMFEPIRYKGDYMLDGALSENMPRTHFPTDETLFLDFDIGSKKAVIESFTAYVTAVLEMTSCAPEMWYRSHRCLTMKASLHVINEPSTNLNLSTEQMLMRMRLGYSSTLDFLYPEFTSTILKVLQLTYDVHMEFAYEAFE